MCTAIQFVVCNQYLWQSFVIKQKPPSFGTACDIIYQDKIEANIDMAYASSTVSFFYTVSLLSSQVAHQVGAYPGFCSNKRLGVFLLPPPPLSWMGR